MEGKNLSDAVNDSAGRESSDPEATVVPPRFNSESVRRARPAVPLAAVSKRRAGSFPTALIIVVAILAGGIVGVIATALHQRNQRESPVSTPVERTTETGTDRPVEQPPSPSTDKAATGVQADARPSETAREDSEPRDSEQATASTTTVQTPTLAEPESEEQRDAHAVLRGALDGWVAATNRRDIEKQMEYYNPTVNAFYLTRNVSREAVRAEKARVFGRAESIDVRADAPQITVARDGRTATMRFRKQYAIEGGAENRRGAVLQELRWRRTRDGWKITSERDLQVLKNK